MHKGDIVLEFINIDKQLADLFTISLRKDRFCIIRRETGMIGSVFA